MKILGRYLCLFLLIIWLGFASRAQDKNKIDSLTERLHTSRQDTNQVKILFTLTWEHMKSRSNLSVARTYADSARALSRKLDYGRGLAMVNYYYGVMGRLEGNYNQALKHFSEYNNYFEISGDSNRLASSLYQIAVIHSYLGNFEKSLSTYLRILRIYEMIDDPYMIATTLNSIGIIHKNLNNYEPALGNYQSALTIFDSLNARLDMADCLHNMGNVYALKKDFSVALDYYNRSLDIDRELENQWGIAYQLESIGNVHAEMGNYQQALFNHLRSLEIREALGQKKEIVTSLINVGTDYSKSGKHDLAIQHFNRALEISREIGSKPELRDAYFRLSETYAERGVFNRAYDYHRLFATMKDSLLNEEMSRQINEMQAKYETEKKEQEIQLLNKEKQVQKAEIAQQKIAKNAFVIGFLLLAVLIFVLIWSYRQKLKNREMIAKKNEEINHQKILELEKNQKLLALDAMISGQEVERKRIAQDLHDGLGALLSSVQMQFNRIDAEITKLREMDVYTKANEMLDEACREVRKIAHNMMPGTLLKLGLVPALKDLCDKIRESNTFSIDFQSYGLEERLTEVTEVTIYRLVQEALNNIIKHAKAKEVIVQVARNEDNISITIEDDGVGFHVSEALEKGGMGMKNLDSRVKYLNGELDIVSEIGKGTTINIEIPV